MKTFLCLLLALSAAPSMPGALALVPPVQEWNPRDGEHNYGWRWSVRAASSRSDDRFAAEQLAAEVRLHGGTVAATVGLPAILLGRPGDPLVDRELAKYGLAGTVPSEPESYLLDVRESRVLLAARDAAGVFYAAQTLRQLMRPAASGFVLPAGTVRDWPAMKLRGISVDLAQGAVPTEVQLRSIIETAAEYKLNTVSFYVQHLMAFRASPLLPPRGAEPDPATLRRLVEFASRRHVFLLPQQQTFGHLHHLLKFENYASLGEAAHGTTLTAGDPAVYRWIEGMAEEMGSLFPGKLFHAGGDETWDLGKGVNRTRVEKEGKGGPWVDHMTRVAGILRESGRRTLFWGDVVLPFPELIQRLPKDMIAATWDYNADGNFAHDIAPFREAGLDVIVCPSVNNWSKPIPDFNVATANIGRFVAEGQRQGAIGMLNTIWFDDGESLYDVVWYGVLYSAAASWVGSGYPREQFDAAFDWAFYRHSGNAIAQAVRQLSETHEAMRRVGLQELANGHVWADPFSRRGALLYSRVLPEARKIRLLAEEALTAILDARPHCRAHTRTLDALEFGARRIDWFGMRVQFAAEMEAFYRDAWTHQQDVRRVNYALLNISDINGRVQDLRDAAGEMKEFYRSAWLAANRPYLLNGMLALYDRELRYWLDRATRIEEIRAAFRVDRTLPDPVSAGFPDVPR